MRSLLVLNPNTSEAVTQLLGSHAQATAGPQVVVHAATARLGAPYIADEASYAVAAHAALDLWAAELAHGVKPHAVLIGCFGDPGLFALREASPVPVTGLAEGAMAEAARLGPFAIVTGGERWKPMLRRLARALDLDSLLVDVLTVAPTGAQLAADPAAAQALLAHACLEAAALPGVRSVILGGAGLAGLAARIQPAVPVAVIDSVAAGVRHALTLAPPAQRAEAGFDVTWIGLAPELRALGLP